MVFTLRIITLQWRHTECDDLISPASRLFTQPFIQAQIKKTSKLRVIGLCEGNSPGTGEFPALRASNAENVSISWRHHVILCSHRYWNSGKDLKLKKMVLHGWSAASNLDLIGDLKQKYRLHLWRVKSQLKLRQKQHSTPDPGKSRDVMTLLNIRGKSWNLCP